MKFLNSLFFLPVLFIACTPAEEAPANDSPSLPNIIFILADDLGYGDLSSFGQTNFQTPNLDRMAAEGMKLLQHYSGSTVCAPSRSALMTGLHTGHTFVRGNKEVRPEGQYPLPDSIFTLPELLKQQGYVTAAFGKWGLGFPGSEGDPNNQGFDQFVGYNCQRLAHHYYPRYLWDNQEKVIFEENQGFDKGNFVPNYIQERSLAFMEAHQDEPFFLFVPTPIPHAELIAPDSIMDKYRGKYLPEHVYEGYDEGEKYRNGPYESQQESHAAFVAMIEILDRHVGQIMDKVTELGIEDNTLIIFSSDNGPHLEGGADPDYFDSNGPLKGYKRDLYEGGIRVPTIARWPGKIKAGSSSNHISAFWDLMPTLAELIGAKVPEGLDGISFLPTLLGEGQQQVHPYLYWEFHERGGRIAIRKGDWKAVKYNHLKEPEAPFELYNLAEDIGETNNLAPMHPDIMEEMNTILKGARTESEVFRFGAR
ncbi:MAG: arylsulfatase [Bacteroidota bacterium]